MRGVHLTPGWLSTEEADALFAATVDGLPWRQDHLRMFGKTHAVPRLHCWFADAGQTYRWSGIHMDPAPWTPALTSIRRRLERELEATFPFLLANLYRDGSDTVGWHADDEAELGPRPLLASVSVGAEREFVLRDNRTRERTAVSLPHGSLLVLDGALQKTHQHCLPRRKRVKGARVNLSFRGR